MRLFGYAIRVRAASLLSCAMLSLLAVSAISMRSMALVEARQTSHSLGFVPAKRLTTNFEREILNARIFFIYYVTIQKPGAYEKGWQHYREVEASLAQLTALTSQRDDLGALRGPVAKLQSDLDSYRTALSAVLTMVQSGILNGPAYDAQVKEWAARGGVLVTDAGSVEKLAFTQSEGDSGRVLVTLKQRETWVMLAFLGGLLACLAASFRVEKMEPAPAKIVSINALETGQQAI